MSWLDLKKGLKMKRCNHKRSVCRTLAYDSTHNSLTMYDVDKVKWNRQPMVLWCSRCGAIRLIDTNGVIWNKPEMIKNAKIQDMW